MKKIPETVYRYVIFWGEKLLKKANTSYGAAEETATAAMTTAATRRRLNQNKPRAGRSNARLIEGTDRV